MATRPCSRVQTELAGAQRESAEHKAMVDKLVQLLGSVHVGVRADSPLPPADETVPEQATDISMSFCRDESASDAESSGGGDGDGSVLLLSIDGECMPSPVKGRVPRAVWRTTGESASAESAVVEPSRGERTDADSYLPYVKQYPELKRIMAREEYEAFVVERAKRRERRALRKLKQQQQQQQQQQ